MIVAGAGLVVAAASGVFQACNYGTFVAGDRNGSAREVANSYLNAINAGRWDVVRGLQVPEYRNVNAVAAEEICWIENPVATDPVLERDHPPEYRFTTLLTVESPIEMRASLADPPSKFDITTQSITMVRNSTSDPWLVLTLVPDYG